MSIDIPKLPSEISSDGREIWDWAFRLGDAAQKLDKVRKIQAQIRRLENECGSCSHWMTKSCPREVHCNIKGRSSGPSCAATKCSKFVLGWSGKSLIDEAKNKLGELEYSHD